MDVLRHHDISNKREPVAVPNLAENLNESILGTNGTQERNAPVTTERDEMQMPAPVNPNEFVGHGVEAGGPAFKVGLNFRVAGCRSSRA